jgi:hypothetical protein
MPQADLQVITEKLREAIGDNVLFLPKSFDVYLNASVEQLLSAKNTIEGALKLKELE